MSEIENNTYKYFKIDRLVLIFMALKIYNRNKLTKRDIHLNIRRKYNMKKNFIALAMAAVCFAGTASVPAFAASKFADINDVPWAGAEQYINQAADLGLMAGYTGKKQCNILRGCSAYVFYYDSQRYFTEGRQYDCFKMDADNAECKHSFMGI